MSIEERGRLMVKLQRLAENRGALERAKSSASPSRRVLIDVGLEALDKAMAEIRRRIGEMGGQ